jgi:hypothetical protein
VKHAMIGISEEIKHDADISYCLWKSCLRVSKKGKGLLQISVLESRQQWYEITSKHLMAIIYATAWVS